MKFTHSFRSGTEYTAEEALEYRMLDIDPYDHGGKIERLEEQVNRLRRVLVKLALRLPEKDLAGFVEDVTDMQRIKEKK